MRIRVGLLVSVAIVGVVSLATYAPRLGHEFPSMVDDWHAILSGPAQLHEVLRLGNPEEQRYRPGFVMWSALQWHTLGAPTSFVGPQFWGLLRWAVLVVGLTLLSALLVGRGPSRIRGLEARWLLVIGVPLVVVTAASIAIDIARFGPQEPLLVGCMSLGAVVLVHAVERLLDPGPTRSTTIVMAVGGVALWSFGVLQKETSLSVLVLAPFLWPTIRAQRERWARLDRGRHRGLALLAGAIFLPFVPIATRTVELSLAGERVYEDIAATKSFTSRLREQFTEASDVLHTSVFSFLLFAGIVLLAVTAVRFGVDWLSAGLVLTPLAFVFLAAEAGVVASRYYIPSLALLALAVARMVVSFRVEVIVAVGLAMVGLGTWQARDAHAYVERWVEGEVAQETLVREAAARAAAGCTVEVTGLNIELVQALPVLMPLAAEAPRDCERGSRYLVVIDEGGAGTVTSDEDPVYAACKPEPNAVWSSNVGTILRCTT